MIFVLCCSPGGKDLPLMRLVKPHENQLVFTCSSRGLICVDETNIYPRYPISLAYKINTIDSTDPPGFSDGQDESCVDLRTAFTSKERTAADLEVGCSGNLQAL